MKKNALYIWVCLLFCLVSCQDEEIINNGFDPSLKGKKEVAFTMQFEPMFPALDSRTAGDAIKYINDLNILIYEANDVSKPVYHLYSSNEDRNDFTFTTEDSDTPSFDGELGAGQAESKTCRATFKYTLPYGQYKIIAVANYKKKIAIADVIDTNNDNCLSEDEIRSIKLSWDTKDIAENNQMFGFFRTEKGYVDVIGTTETTEEVIISPETTELHAWLKRAASKVTVAYDGSKLNENVYITLKSVQIKGIPEGCTLGEDYAAKSNDDLIEEGEKINYLKDDDGPVITRGGVNRGSLHIEGWDEPYDPTDSEGKAHTETSQALFFYENMQGKGEAGTSTDKSLNKLEYVTKGKEFGTYIEVKAHYENKNEGDVSSGEITYRFMLGKDVTTDYNAERNYHYKLTLCFNKDANDVDWRIEYKEEPGIYVPNPYYISYLYCQSMNLPLKVVIDEDDEITELKAEIVENNWEPDGDTQALGNKYYGNTEKEYYAINSKGKEVEGKIGKGNTEIPWVGFLSLVDEYKANNNSIILDAGFEADADKYVNKNNNKVPHSHWINNGLGSQTYTDSKGTEENTGTTTKSVSYSIPLYTRVKQLYSVSGFTGNNPYVGYNRTAKVRFTATTKEGKTYSEEVKIIQVKRLVNPTGIWRGKNNAAPFNVVLKEQSEYEGNFEDLISDGPWSVETTGDWFSVSPKEGPTGSKVAFTYSPHGITGRPRCGIIEVKYHNETCTHLIFVRQGYDPIAIVQGGAEWYSFNMKKKNEMAKSPLDEGSLYRWGKWESPIAEENNVNPKFKYGVNPESNKFAIVGSTSSSWKDISSSKRTVAFNSMIKGTRIASPDDYLALRNEMQGYGVLYGDGAEEVATTPTDAYGYREAYNGADKGKRGMRGVFAYNSKTGANVFFPIGAVGHGHRKQEHTNDDVGRGVLRYGTMNDKLMTYSAAFPKYRPMLYALDEQNGAIYWTYGEYESEKGHGWDINFDQLDFNIYTYKNAWTGDNNAELSDACFVRLVKE